MRAASLGGGLEREDLDCHLVFIPSTTPSSDVKQPVVKQSSLWMLLNENICSQKCFMHYQQHRHRKVPDEVDGTSPELAVKAWFPRVFDMSPGSASSLLQTQANLLKCHTPNTYFAAPTDALAAEHYPNSTLYNTDRSAAAGCFVRQTSSCQPIMGGCLFVFPCHLPVVSSYTAEMLHRHIRNQEIPTDWDGQHPGAVVGFSGRPARKARPENAQEGISTIPKCVSAPMLAHAQQQQKHMNAAAWAQDEPSSICMQILPENFNEAGNENNSSAALLSVICKTLKPTHKEASSVLSMRISSPQGGLQHLASPTSFRHTESGGQHVSVGPTITLVVIRSRDDGYGDNVTDWRIELKMKILKADTLQTVKEITQSRQTNPIVKAERQTRAFNPTLGHQHHHPHTSHPSPLPYSFSYHPTLHLRTPETKAVAQRPDILSHTARST
ncbi:unnamed protein product [Pleuronectes platessa]|uniref:Uncharacterized protein n=1 Tax=Pleuronectes platessa TaxID=8262 RepID=A0A9N7Z081_PLEPL|nr:unnamed protein product [Pleuronectes platessa]